MERFWHKVEKTEECWLWTACLRGKSGYGCFKYERKTYDAHRFVWFLTYGYFSKAWILHKCDNRKCVNPKHLFEGSAKDNFEDALRKGRVSLIRKRKYKTKEEKRLAHLPGKRGYWHKRGKYLRMMKRKKIKNILL